MVVKTGSAGLSSADPVFPYRHLEMELSKDLLDLVRGLSKFSAVVVCHNVEVPSAQKLTTNARSE